MAQQVRRAAALTAELAAQSEKKVAMVCDHPPGLRDEPAEHITAPNMGAGGSHSQAEMMHSQARFFQQARASLISRGDSVEDDHDQPREPKKQGMMKLRCGNNSRVRSVRSSGEVETTGKHAPKMKSVSKR